LYGKQQALSGLRLARCNAIVLGRTTVDRLTHANELVAAKKLFIIPVPHITMKITGEFKQTAGFAH
jgi:hypothetical protein